MNDPERNESFIHPTVARILRTIGLSLVCLAVFLSAKTAFTFCLGLFAEGNHVVMLPGLGNPIVSLEQRQAKKSAIDPDDLEVVDRAEIMVGGNLIFHMPIVNAAWTGDGYDFHSAFQYIAPYLGEADYSAAALETTFAGFNKGISGNPWFNSPDEIAPTLYAAGFDALVTSTEHAYDMDVSGLLRTITTLRGSEITALGTVESADSPRYILQTLNGIPIGMAAYVQAQIGDDGSVTVNGLTADELASGYINAFDPEHLSRFYTEAEGLVSSMKAAGAESIVLFLHWGSDYSTTADSNQRTVAQALCDLGVDVIVGSHPCVVQPVDLLTSSVDPAHNTLVIYSAGNLLSNLRADTTDVVSGHTEDGFLFRFTLSRYNDDSVRLSEIHLLPVWTAVYGTGENRDFCILPLDSSVPDWALAYDLNDSQLHDAKNSYNRTMAIVTSGLNKINHTLSPKPVTSAPAEPVPTVDPSLGVG